MPATASARPTDVNVVNSTIATTEPHAFAWISTFTNSNQCLPVTGLPSTGAWLVDGASLQAYTGTAGPGIQLKSETDIGSEFYVDLPVESALGFSGTSYSVTRVPVVPFRVNLGTPGTVTALKVCVIKPSGVGSVNISGTISLRRIG